MSSPTPDQIEADIEAQRVRLADTVDALTRKLDVKAQARSRLRRVGPQEVATAAGIALAVVALVWWRRHR